MLSRTSILYRTGTLFAHGSEWFVTIYVHLSHGNLYETLTLAVLCGMNQRKIAQIPSEYILNSLRGKYGVLLHGHRFYIFLKFLTHI